LADIEVDVDGRTHDEVAQLVLTALTSESCPPRALP
jgi:hypothetical protein